MEEDHREVMELACQHEPQQFEAWANAQLALVDLGDARRNDRLVSLLSVVAQRPGKSLPEQCQHDAPLKATYRLLDCPALKHEDVIASSAAATVEQLQARPIPGMVPSLQDTTSFNVHGLLECEVHARDEAAQKARKGGERNRMPAAQKES